MLNEDCRDMLQALADEKIRFLLVGAYALGAHGFSRATMDMEIRVVPSPLNAEAVLRALRRFGACLLELVRYIHLNPLRFCFPAGGIERQMMPAGGSGTDHRTDFRI